MYCSKCGAWTAAGAAFCSSCGQAFPVVAVPHPPIASVAVAAPVAGGMSTIPPYAVSGSVPRVAYAGFWLRLLALLIDNVILGFGFVLIVIPLILLTGFRRFLDEFHPDEALNDSGIFMIIIFFFLAATGALVFTWLYHALMECSEWQATVGKKALGLVVTDMAGQRVSFGRATARHFGKIVTNLVSFGIGLGYLMAAFTDKKQALHDMLAGCLILRRHD